MAFIVQWIHSRLSVSKYDKPLKLNIGEMQRLKRLMGLMRRRCKSIDGDSGVLCGRARTRGVRCNVLWLRMGPKDKKSERHRPSGKPKWCKTSLGCGAALRAH